MSQPPENGEESEGGNVKPGNVLPVWGNPKTMNLNSLILTNVQGSTYFKVTLFGLKTYHEVVDEIYYKVGHLEPWEMGSRKIGGQTGMCGGVRGVGAGGIVSSAFCLLYKLFTLKLTRKQLTGMMNHSDSPYIRGLAFMYARYTLPPADLWDWFQDYLADEEEIDVKAGGGLKLYMGDMVREFLLKLDWFGALFPRIPVPIQKTINANMKEYGPSIKDQYHAEREQEEKAREEAERAEREAERLKREEERKQRDAERAREAEKARERHRGRDYHRGGYRERDRPHYSRGGSDSYRDRDREKEKYRSDKDRKRSRSRERRRSRDRSRERRRTPDRKSHKSRRSRSRERRSR